MVEPWFAELARGEHEAAWDCFLDRYRKLIFAAIYHYAEDYDDVMEIFTRVCESLHEQDLARLRKYTSLALPRPRFSTWLATVVRNLTIDWFRHRDGRKQLSVRADRLPPVQRSIFEYIFHEQRSHLEAYELLTTRDGRALSFREFLRELRATYQALSEGRRGRLTLELGAGLPPDVDPPLAEDPALISERKEFLALAMSALSPEDRLVVQLFVVAQLPAAEVARLVGLPNAKAVYNRTYRALAAMRGTLEQQGLRPGDL